MVTSDTLSRWQRRIRVLPTAGVAGQRKSECIKGDSHCVWGSPFCVFFDFVCNRCPLLRRSRIIHAEKPARCLAAKFSAISLENTRQSAGVVCVFRSIFIGTYLVSKAEWTSRRNQMFRCLGEAFRPAPTAAEHRVCAGQFPGGYLKNGAPERAALQAVLRLFPENADMPLDQ